MSKNNVSIKKRVLVTGGSGLFGTNFAFMGHERFMICSLYNHNAISNDNIVTIHYDFNKNPEQLNSIIREFRPDIIIHAGALTNVDACEEDRLLAEKINFQWTRQLVSYAEKEKNLKLIFISTDQVFDGTKGNYSEEDIPNPINVYGTYKRKSEECVTEFLENYLVLRVNFFGFGVFGDNTFGEWIINTLKKGDRLYGFYDVLFTSLLVNTLVDFIHQAIALDMRGLFHIGGETVLSKYDFIRKIAYQFNFDAGLLEKKSIKQCALKAPRPADMSMNSDKFFKKTNLGQPDIDHEIKRFEHLYSSGYKEKLRSFYV